MLVFQKHRMGHIHSDPALSNLAIHTQNRCSSILDLCFSVCMCVSCGSSLVVLDVVARFVSLLDSCCTCTCTAREITHHDYTNDVASRDLNHCTFSCFFFLPPLSCRHGWPQVAAKKKHRATPNAIANRERNGRQAVRQAASKIGSLPLLFRRSVCCHWLPTNTERTIGIVGEKKPGKKK